MVAGSSASEKSLGAQLLRGEMEALRSSLLVGYGGGLERLLLELVSCEAVASLPQVSSDRRATRWIIAWNRYPRSWRERSCRGSVPWRRYAMGLRSLLS